MNKTEKVVLKHIFKARPEVVFKLWTTPSLMTQWFDATCGGDPGKINVQDVAVDLRVGGKYKLSMGGTALHSGEYREITPYHRLAFTWSSPVVSNTLVTLDLKPLDDKTELTLTHELIPTEWVDAHNKGWTQLFENIDLKIAH